MEDVLVVFRDEQGQLWVDYESLVHAITTTVLPQYWDTVGELASICSGTFGPAKILIVSHTYHGHRQIAALLAEIRDVAQGAAASEPPLRPRPEMRDEGRRKTSNDRSEGRRDKK